MSLAVIPIIYILYLPVSRAQHINTTQMQYSLGNHRSGHHFKMPIHVMYTVLKYNIILYYQSTHCAYYNNILYNIILNYVDNTTGGVRFYQTTISKKS